MKIDDKIFKGAVIGVVAYGGLSYLSRIIEGGVSLLESCINLKIARLAAETQDELSPQETNTTAIGFHYTPPEEEEEDDNGEEEENYHK